MKLWRRFVLLVGVLATPLLSAFVRPAAAAEPLRVMTFNIRYGTAPDGDNEWSKRRSLLFEVVEKFDPDLLCVQEALDAQIVELVERFDGYDHVGVGRDDGKKEGEYSAILYRTGRLSIARSGTFWFSETPNAPMSMTWGNQFPRICTWGEFVDRSSTPEARLRVYNVHWDHIAEEANLKMGKMLAKRVADECGAETPVIITGDFNSDEQSPAFKELLGGPAQIADTFRRLYPKVTEVGTYHSFTGQGGAGKIDAVLASDRWNVLEAAIVRTSKPPVYPSDHFPVTAVLTLKD